jgi:hypothetical protein
MLRRRSLPLLLALALALARRRRFQPSSSADLEVRVAGPRSMDVGDSHPHGGEEGVRADSRRRLCQRWRGRPPLAGAGRQARTAFLRRGMVRVGGVRAPLGFGRVGFVRIYGEQPRCIRCPLGLNLRELGLTGVGSCALVTRWMRLVGRAVWSRCHILKK